MPISIQPENGGGAVQSTQPNIFNYNVQIDGQPVYPLYGFNITKSLDLSLDTSTIILPNITLSQKYPINTWVRIERWVLSNQSDKETFDFLVGDSVVEHLNSTPPLYNHTLQLIEYTKLLEQDIVSTKLFTQPGAISERSPYTLLDVVEGLINSVTLQRRVGFSLKYEIESTLAAELATIKSPELRFNNVTLKEALDRVFSYIKGVARLVKGGVKDIIVCDKFEALGQLITLVKEAQVEEQDLSNYGNIGVIQVANAVSNEESVAKTYYPSQDGWATITDSQEEDGILRTGDLELKTNLPIYKILKVEAYYGGTKPNPFERIVVSRDITDYIFDKERWDNLPDKGSTPINDAENKILSKANTIYYERGSRNIKGLSETFAYPWSFGEFPRIKRLLITDFIQYQIENSMTPWNPTEIRINGLFRGIIPTLQDNLPTIMYRITYIPFIENSNFELEKQKPTITDKIKTFINQQDRLIDIEALGRSIQNTIDQTGQPVRKITRKHRTVQGLYKIGDFTSDGYIVKSADYINERNFIEGKYTLTKDFFEINKFIGIDREYRAYDVILAAQDAIRTVNYKDYVLVSDTFKQTSTSLIFQPARQTFIETLLPAASVDKKIRNVIFKNQDDQESPYIAAPTTGNAFGKSLIINWQFNHALFAGYQMNRTITFEAAINNQIPVPYTDEEGLLEEFSIIFQSDLKFPQPDGTEERRAEVFELSKALPIFEGPFEILGSNLADPFVLKKDPSEILAMNYILQTYTDKENIIIGNELLENNLLIGGVKRPLVLYTSTTENYKITDQYAKGTNRGLITNLVTSVSTTGANNITVAHTSIATSQSWAIADQATNKILLAVNREGGVLPTTIHFHFLRNKI